MTIMTKKERTEALGHVMLVASQPCRWVSLWQQQLLCSTDAKLQCEPHGCIAPALAG